jgi:ribosome-binding factor A
VGLRRLRANEAIRETLSTVIAAEGLKDPRVGFVTVTGVEATPDLRHAKVFVSVLGSAAERDATMQALDNSRGFLQARLGDSLRMKRTPQLQFVYDETLDNALHISKLLKREEEVLGSEPREIPIPGVDMPEEESGEDVAPTGSAPDDGEGERA